MGKLIGVFATDIASRVQGKIYHALHEYLKTRGYTLVFFSAELDRSNFSNTDVSAFQLLTIAERMEFSAIFIHAESIQNREMIDTIIDMGKTRDIPVFLYDCNNSGYSHHDGVITINPNYKQGFEDAVTHLIEHHGCKNIYMLAGTEGNKYSEERIDAYRKVMTAHGLVCTDDRITYGGFWEIPAIKAVNELMDKVEKEHLPFPDAICSANDSMAIAAAKELVKRGYRVPDDIMVTGFDGIEDGKFSVPAISTCEPILESVPEYIVNAIENNIRSDEFLVPLRFIPKESCNCENSYKHGDAMEMAGIMENARQNIWQHSMLSNLQLSLMNSCDNYSLYGGMLSTVQHFNGLGLLYCLREDIEVQDDFTTDYERVVIRLDYDFYNEYKPYTFPVEEIIPDYDKIIAQSDGREFFVFQILHSSADKFGYSVIKGEKYVSNKIRIFSQSAENFTNMLESILRNRRLEQANRKLNEMYEKMSEIYIRDVMTGLYNRTGYYKELEECLKSEDVKDGYINVISVDMDGLKQINDNFGHQEGDIAIQAVAEAIRECIDSPAILARFGGDEFMVSLFTKSESELSGEDISERLNSYISGLSSLQGKPYRVGVSVGKAVSKVSEIDEIKTLEKLADDRMYDNKHERKGIR